MVRLTSPHWPHSQNLFIGPLPSIRIPKRTSLSQKRSLISFGGCRRTRILTLPMIHTSLPLNGSLAREKKRLCLCPVRLNLSVDGWQVNGRSRR